MEIIERRERKRDGVRRTNTAYKEEVWRQHGENK
jgi:hypothetical protein